ncbi:MAG: NADH dehydrogenase (quinone) subunit G [Candidatus Zixiibacteriota bacterium]|nr:MAG: NADH dehydrogenase (quinone) subunit G [candidate division Zixibacteria bacterium]
MANLIMLNIDGQDVEVEPGTYIIEAARKLGIEIPTFCYDQRLKSVGACRMCLVEVEKSPKLVASCATPVAPGMVVKTNSEKVIKARKSVLEFLLVNHPLDCPTCDKGGECTLQNLTFQYGPTVSRLSEDKFRFQDDPNQKFDDIKLGPEIWMNKNRCIICYKCVRIARDLAGGADLGIFQRGAFAKVDIPKEIKYANEFSGNTVENCPVGALMSDSFRYKIRSWLLKGTDSVCWLCPDGCNITIEHNQGRIYRHQSRRNDDVDMGFICDKGRYGFDITSHPERITVPHAVNGDNLEKVSYDEALAMMVHRFTEVQGETSALLLDTSLTNENAFSAADYFQTKLPGSSIAITSEIELNDIMSYGHLGLSVSLSELENADLVIILGCDLAVEHPIIGLRIKKLINKGVPVYFISPRQLYLGRFNVYNIRANYGREFRVIEDIISLRNGNDDIKINKDIKEQLELNITSAKNIHMIAGGDLLANPNRNKYLQSLFELGKSLRAKLSILTTETNYIGIGLVGRTNATFEEIIEKIEKGEIKTLFVAGGDPVNVYPDRNRITEAFKKLDYMIYWGAFLNHTARLATLVMPSVLPTEDNGSFINVERRLQFLDKSYSTPKEITSLIKLFTDIKIELGGGLYYSASDVFPQMARVIPEFNGLRYKVSEGHIFPSVELEASDNLKALDVKPPPDYPYVLMFAKNVYYGASGMTSKSNTLRKLTPSQKLLINPHDARKEGVMNDSKIRLSTDSAAGEITAIVSEDINQGELLLSGYSDENPPNKFMVGFNKPVYAKIEKV